MLSLTHSQWMWCLGWARVRWRHQAGRRFRSARGQAVMEYLMLFIFLSLLAAVVYRFVAPLIEGTIVKIAEKLIAMNVAGENP